jgi:multicomponent K+:H+ antiporter subunit E
MRKLLPYPLLALSLIVMWMLLTSFSLGNLLLGIAVSFIACWSMAALRPSKPRLRGWYLLPKLIGIVLYDIIRSNIAVASIILSGKRRKRRAGFIVLDLKLRDPMGLAVLAVIITSTPGTAWFDYNDASGRLAIHVFDLVDEQAWIELIHTRYEQLLMEIFE